ncbi:Lpg1974 family pore-forming outer membrane protein [Crateriforma spongiae]|uniref:Lpg1974 family pore-forming outer membrane protein n=1 Tax=Crateriforma spongiae TaxID=2724528 RepID=UPI001F2FBD6C|nr:Lpg1974 family pore-forming outer membrane protein [Crateriforma spongiae]
MNMKFFARILPALAVFGLGSLACSANHPAAPSDWQTFLANSRSGCGCNTGPSVMTYGPNYSQPSPYVTSPHVVSPGPGCSTGDSSIGAYGGSITATPGMISGGASAGVGPTVTGSAMAGSVMTGSGACGSAGVGVGGPYGGGVYGGGYGGSIIAGNAYPTGGYGYGAACAPAPQPIYRPRFSLSGFYGGFEFLWLRAHFDQNVAMIIDPPVGNRLVPFDYSYDFSPRVWLGWENCRGNGFRATYFRYEDEADIEQFTAAAGQVPVYVEVYGAGGNLARNAYADAIGETLTSSHRLELQSLDLEATHLFEWCAMRARMGFGLRLAEMEQNLHARVYLPDGTLEEIVTNDLSFRGVGPTVSMMFTQPLWKSRFSLYGNLRGSLLMAETEQYIYEMKGAYTTELVDIAEQREILTNLEMGLGIQFGQSIGRRAGMFVRAGYETQVWFDAGGPVDSHSTIGLDGITLGAGLSF